MESKETTFRTFRRLLKVYGSKKILGIVIFLTAILALANITVSYSLKKLLDSALGQNLSIFRQMIYLLLGLTLVQMLSRYLSIKLIGIYTERGARELRDRMADGLVHLSIYELEQKHSGDLVSRMTNDLNRIREFTTKSLINIIYQPLAALGAFCFLITINWKLTLITSIGVPFIFKLSSFLSKPVARHTKSLQEQLALVNKQLQDTIGGMELVRAYRLQKILAKKYNQEVDAAVGSGLKVASSRMYLRMLANFIGIAPFFVCFGFGGYWVIKGQMTPGSLIAFITLLNPLTFPISQLPNLLGALKGQMAAAARIFEILDLPQERKNGTKWSIDPKQPVVQFDQVSFAYPNGEQVLDNVSFTVRPGEKVALVGLSGSGKSTIFKLILGYYDNYTGRISVFDHPLQEWSLKELRKQIGLVAQDTYLFPGTIEENIALGQKVGSTKVIQQAAKTANAHSFILQLKDGYQTDVGEYGDRLSGGQKQRISIARSVLKNAPLLLLDEATSALDTQSEFLVQKALENSLQESTTSMVIGHRLSTVKDADQILVLEAGRIVETGTHEKLMELNGVYRKLYMHQSSGHADGLEAG